MTPPEGMGPGIGGNAWPGTKILLDVPWQRINMTFDRGTGVDDTPARALELLAPAPCLMFNRHQSEEP
jgi:hypothetical protein